MTTYNEYMIQQARIFSAFAIDTGIAEERQEGDYMIIRVNGFDIAKEHIDKDLCIPSDWANIPMNKRVWFASFQKAANEYHQKKVEEKRNKPKRSSKDLLAVLQAA